MSTPAAPLKVAVVTPYFQESPEVLSECCRSVREQSYPCTHFLVSDGSPRVEVREWPGEHILLPRPHGDVGNTPRGIGALSAMNQGYDAVAFLDADNWYYPGHIEAMVKLHQQSGVAVCRATRTIHRLDGSLMFVDTHESTADALVDTSCLFVTRAAFVVLPLWAMMPKELGVAGDSVIWTAIRSRRFSTAQHPEPTVAFRSQYELHYRRIGETPPPGIKTKENSSLRAKRWWDALPADERTRWTRYLFNVDPSLSG